MMGKKNSKSYFSPNNATKCSIPMFFIILLFAIISLTNFAYRVGKQTTLQENAVDNEGDADREFVESLILPPNITRREDRLAWYARKLPNSSLLKSDELARRFHSRVSEFIDRGCSIKFFMMWFSPAKNFGKRIFFTMESIFKNHPKGCLIIVSRTMDTLRGYKTLKPLMDRGFRVLAVTPDVHFLLNNTPGEDWIRGIMAGTRDPGSVPLPQNLSNLLRLAVLYKYGGVYIDTDYIILRDMSGLRNVIGAQSTDLATKKWSMLNNAALVFDAGHPVLYEFIKEFATTFNGKRWGYNGPHMVSRVVERLGNGSECNVTVLPPEAFYPVDWIEIQMFLKKPKNANDTAWVEKTVGELNNGATYGVHLWNSKIRGLTIEEGSVLATLISQQCIVCEDIVGS